MNLAERLYLRLLEALRQGGLRHDQEITVGDVYQHLVPYRAVRSELGVFELAEYEHALLQLLAGEGGFLQVADEAVRSELAAELRSPNPILGIYRDYAASAVVLLRSGEELRPAASTASSAGTRPEGAEEEAVRPVTDFLQEDSDDAARESSASRPVDEIGGRNAPPPPAPAVGSASGAGDSWEQAEPGGRRPLPPLDYPSPAPVPADATHVAGHSPPPTPAKLPQDARPTQLAHGECVHCGRTLPEVEGIRYCPYCGADQTVVPCERCGTPLQPEWSFCIRCGARRSVPPSPGA